MPLPSMHYEYMERKTAKVSSDFHVRFDNAYYSVVLRLHQPLFAFILSPENSFMNGQERLIRVSGQRIQSICRTTIKDLHSGTGLTLSKKLNLLARIQRLLSVRFLSPDHMKFRHIACAWGF